MTRCRVLVRGRVQGVGFRWFVREHARRLNLSGLVRNHPDGTVEVHAEGGPAEIEAILLHLRRGPEGASVSAVEMLAPPPSDAILPAPFAIEK